MKSESLNGLQENVKLPLTDYKKYLQEEKGSGMAFRVRKKSEIRFKACFSLLCNNTKYISKRTSAAKVLS